MFLSPVVSSCWSDLIFSSRWTTFLLLALHTPTCLQLLYSDFSCSLWKSFIYHFAVKGELAPLPDESFSPFCIVIISITIDDTHVCGYNLYLLNTVLDTRQVYWPLQYRLYQLCLNSVKDILALDIWDQTFWVWHSWLNSLDRNW